MKCTNGTCEGDMEKARNTSVLVCRDCGATSSTLSRAEMAQRIEALEKRNADQDEEKQKKAKEIAENPTKEKEEAWL